MAQADKSKKDFAEFIVDEKKLESDINYRFRFVAQVIGMTAEDKNILRTHRALIESILPKIVANVYQKMFQYDSMKRHVLPRQWGFDGAVPAKPSELGLDHEQTKFRKMRLEEYFKKLCTAEWDDTFAALVDLVGHMHTSKKGNSNLQVPLVQITALLGTINDLFLEAISKLELSTKTQLALQRAYTKLFWMQNSMFVRHWTNE